MKISIVIPNYNSGKYLAKSLDSIFQQDYSDYEVVVADGFSTDNSISILKEYQKIHANLFVYQTETQGEVAHINYGMAKATGDIVVWLCADDTFVPGCFSAVVSAFKDNVQWVYGRVKIIDSADKEVRGIVTKLKEVVQPRYSYTALKCVCFIAEPSVFMRKTFYQQIGEYDDRLPLTADYDYWLRAGKISKPVFINKYLANWRAHDNSTSVNNYKKQMLSAYQVQKRYSGWIFRPIQWLSCQLIILLYKRLK